jgi:hypothetical protein
MVLIRVDLISCDFSMEIDFDFNGGGSIPSVGFKQKPYFTDFMKLFWSRATRKATNHFREDLVS